jgi:septum site-determining protein MinD
MERGAFMTGKVVTVTSGKGGVGKTTATANIGAALAAVGNKVVCIDADIGLRNLDVVLGLENRIVYDLVDVVEGRCRLRQALIRDKRLPELFLIPAAQTRDKSAVSPSDMVRLCEDLRQDFDWILIDSPAGIERGFRNALAPANIVLVVTNPEVSAVRDADRIIGLVEAEEKGPARLVINRIKPSMVRRGEMLSADDVLELLAVELIGMIPDDENVVTSTNRGLPIVMDGRSKAGQAFRNIARRLQGEEVPFLTLEDEGGLFGRLARLIRPGGD